MNNITFITLCLIAVGLICFFVYNIITHKTKEKSVGLNLVGIAVVILISIFYLINSGVIEFNHNPNKYMKNNTEDRSNNSTIVDKPEKQSEDKFYTDKKYKDAIKDLREHSKGE